MLTYEQVEALKARHGDVYLLEVDGADGIVVAVRRPTRTDVARATARLELAERRARRMRRPLQGLVTREARQVFRACVVHPSLAELDALLDRQPGLSVPLLNEFDRICGAHRRPN